MPFPHLAYRKIRRGIRLLNSVTFHGIISAASLNSHTSRTYALLVDLLLDELEESNAAESFEDILNDYGVDSPPCEGCVFE